MQLELISREPKGRRQPTPLLFVHGAYSGAWIWDEHFLPFFAARGYATHAVSLRGHGWNGGRDELMFARLCDYVADVEQTIAALAQPPVLIGHSMGGLVVQKILHRLPIPAAVLLASGPPHGMIPSMLNMAFTNPGLLFDLSRLQTFGPKGGEGMYLRRALFSDQTPAADVARYMARFGAESILVGLDLMGLDLPPSIPCLDVPVLVIGAENDGFVSPGATHATADTYRTKAEIIPGMAHAMMLDHNWRRVASRMVAWLDETLAARISDRVTGIAAA